MSTATVTPLPNKPRRRVTDQSPAATCSLWQRMRCGSKVTGVDVGSRFAKLVSRHQRGSTARVCRADRFEIPEDGLVSAAAIADWLIPWLDADSDGSRDLIITLPTSFLDQETVQIDSSLDEDAVPANLEAEASRAVRELLGAQSDQAVYDAWISRVGETSQLHLVWTNREVVTELARLLGRGGWNCRSISTALVANGRAGQAGLNAQPSQLILDLGCSPSIAWCYNGTPTYIRNKLSLPHTDPVAMVSAALSIRYTDAQFLLRDEGLTIASTNLADSLTGKITESIEPYLLGLLFEISRTIQYLERLRRSNRPVDELIICGGAAGIRGLAEWITKQTGMTARSPHVPSAYRWEAAQAYAPDFSAALALTQSECLQ